MKRKHALAFFAAFAVFDALTFSALAQSAPTTLDSWSSLDRQIQPLDTTAPEQLTDFVTWTADGGLGDALICDPQQSIPYQRTVSRPLRRLSRFQ